MCVLGLWLGTEDLGFQVQGPARAGPPDLRSLGCMNVEAC